MDTTRIKQVKENKLDLIQNIVPAVYNVEFKSLEKGEVYDWNDVQTYKVSEEEVFRTNENEILFTISADGSEHAEYGLNLVLEDFIPLINSCKENSETKKTGKFLVNYVYYSSKDKEYNYSNKKDNVVSKYCEIIGKHKSQGGFFIEDRWSKNHALEQVVKHTKLDKSNYLVLGYFGIKGAKGENKELSRGVDYLLANSEVPTILVKEETRRNKQINKGFNWAFIIDDKNSYHRVKILNSFRNLIDVEHDTVYGFGMFEISVPSYNAVKKEFTDFCEKNNVKNFFYENLIYTNGNISNPVIEKINNGNIIFNFVVFSNSSSKHKINPTENDYLDLIRRCSANICFLNY
jgi:hypothetical protein